ncbi:hypothetical protein C9374_005372 [Naegleria lovaniensis]|uniref:RGS domain-containing protein n=1 Tax=Naegleria lovaniensis TaxID=51637 RepID=A0AA88GQE2_NAELO|nr:uncharacterized protein C9374_005372 [Naegleria lovaniensis]KAG2382170.1 hypothetical protein C9374_005372 [Naegleria lovaniensis]
MPSLFGKKTRINNDGTSHHHSNSSESMVSRYMVVFEEVMNNKDARNCFKQFLKEETHSEAALLFIEELEEYKKEHYNVRTELGKICVSEKSNHKIFKKLVLNLCESARKIMNQHFDTVSIQELNVGKSKAIVVQNWAKIDFQVKNILMTDNNDTVSTTSSNSDNGNNSNVSLPRCSYYDNEGLKQLLFMLEPSTLFDSCEVNVILDLKLDQFPLFSRSKLLDKFLIEMGETFSRSIAIDVSKGKNIDVRFKPKDFESRLLTDKDIYFAFALCEDTPDWNLVYTEPGLSVFLTETNYVFGSDSIPRLSLAKSVILIPYPLEMVWSIFCDKQSRLQMDAHMMDECQTLEYIPPHTTNKQLQESVSEERDHYYDCDKPPLALILGVTVADLRIPFFKKRVCSCTETAIYDPYADCIVQLGHSTSSLSHPTYQDVSKGKVVMDVMFAHIFFRTNENVTRYVHCAYTDGRVPLPSKPLAQMMWKKRSKTARNSFLKQLKDHNSEMHSLEDSFKFKQALSDNRLAYPERSWFREYESRKNSPSLRTFDIL